MENVKKIEEYKELLDGYVKAHELLTRTCNNPGIRLLGVKNEFQITNLIPLCELLGIEYTRKDWSANKQCDTNWDIVYFRYENILIFELVDKLAEEETHEGTENENT